MAIPLLRKTSAAPEPPAIPDIRENREFAVKADLFDALQQKKQALTDLIDLLQLERYVGSRTLDRKSTSDAQLRDHLRWLRARVAITNNPKPATSANDNPDVAAAIELLRGERLKPKPNVTEQLARARQELAIVERAISAQSNIVEQARGELAHALALRMAARNDQLMAAHYKAAQELVRTTNAVKELHANFVCASYGNPRSDIMPAPLLASALALGNENDRNSQIATLGRQLQQKGVI